MKPDKIKQNEINSVKNNYINSVNLNINSDFPYLVLDVINDNAYPRNPGFQVMHWHEDLQFIYVIDGSIEVRTLDNAIQVNSGEAFFINKDVVHYVKRIGNCHYNSFLFPAYFLEFYIGSPVKAFVDSIITNEQLTLFHFTPSVQWHNVIINKLYQLSKLELSRLASRKLESTTLEKDKNIFYPYEVLVLLSSIWLIMIKNISIPTHQEQSLTNLRMQKILQFIDDDTIICLENVMEDEPFMLKEIVIKEQHNCKATGYWKTNSVKYNFLLIAHEYLFVFRK